MDVWNYSVQTSRTEDYMSANHTNFSALGISRDQMILQHLIQLEEWLHMVLWEELNLHHVILDGWLIHFLL